MNYGMRPKGPDKQRRSGTKVLANVLWWLSSVRLGMLLLIAIAVYAAFGTIPLGRVFEWFGGDSWTPGQTLRHLPWVDLRESEYYSTPLFSALLLILIVNMAMATVLRIRWQWRKAGVITTHCGVIVLAIGAYLATKDPLRAIMTVWAGEPAKVMLDSTRTVLWESGEPVSEQSMNRLLPRYADFGVPWTDRQRSINVHSEVAVTGFAHSARMVHRLVPSDGSGSPGWEMTERLRSGESRKITVIADPRLSRPRALTNGMAVLPLGGVWSITELAEFHSTTSSDGAVWIRPESDAPAMVLPARPGSTAALETPSGRWQAEFLERTDALFGFVAGIYRIEGPGLASTIAFSAPWDPTTSGLLIEADDSGGVGLAELPGGYEALFVDHERSALVLGQDGWLLRRGRDGEWQSGPPLPSGDMLQVDERTSVEIDEVLESAAIVQELERLPSAEDAQLLADPRLNSWVRVSSSVDAEAPGRWIPYNDTLAQPGREEGFELGPSPLVFDAGSIRFQGFQAELFRRGSIPQDFLVSLVLEEDDQQAEHILRLNDPVRSRMTINGHERLIQLSLIGWDSRGWESARRNPSPDGFDGARFVILSVNSREGVNTAITGAVIVLLGAGGSMLLRSRGRPRRSGAA
jgi:hypothetical protein